MFYTELDFVHSLENILGVTNVQAMLNSRISLPSIHRIAMEQAFIHKTDNVSTDILRTAAVDLLIFKHYKFNE